MNILKLEVTLLYSTYKNKEKFECVFHIRMFERLFQSIISYGLVGGVDILISPIC